MTLENGYFEESQRLLRHQITEVLSEVNDAASHCDGNRLRPVTGAEFRHYMFDVDFHRLFGDEEFFGNVTIAVSATQLAKNLHFAIGERFVAVMFRQMDCDLRWNPFLSAIFPIRPPHPALMLEDFAAHQARLPFFHDRINVIGMDSGRPLPTLNFIQGNAYVFLPTLIEIVEVSVGLRGVY